MEPQDLAAADRSALMLLLQTVHTDVRSMRSELAEHIANEPEDWAKVVKKISEDAFPDGDADGHRKAHEAQMTAIMNRAEFWRKMAFEITKYGLIGLLGWLAVHAWLAFLQGPTK